MKVKKSPFRDRAWSCSSSVLCVRMTRKTRFGQSFAPGHTMRRRTFPYPTSKNHCYGAVFVCDVVEPREDLDAIAGYGAGTKTGARRRAGYNSITFMQRIYEDESSKITLGRAFFVILPGRNSFSSSVGTIMHCGISTWTISFLFLCMVK